MQSADPISEVAAKIASNHAHTRERGPVCPWPNRVTRQKLVATQRYRSVSSVKLVHRALEDRSRERTRVEK